MMRQGAKQLRLGVTIEGQDGPIRYDFSLAPSGSFAVVTAESLEVGPLPNRKAPLRIIARSGSDAQILDEGQKRRLPAQELLEVSEQRLLLPTLRLLRPKRGVLQAYNALQAISVHLPFEVLPQWAARAFDRKSDLRSATVLTPAQRLDTLGRNLASAYHSLRNEYGPQHWQHTMEILRLGLGYQLEDISLIPGPAGGAIVLFAKFAGLREPIPASQLADGVLCYLAFVALFRLSEAGRSPASLLAIDQPELNLHPELLLRVLQLMESLAHDVPVMLTTHSDQLLDGLSDPVRSALLCELDERRATQLLRPDPEAMERWLQRYRGLGSLRSEGYQEEVLSRRGTVS